jgi:hypothetical protein
MGEGEPVLFRTYFLRESASSVWAAIWLPSIDDGADFFVELDADELALLVGFGAGVADEVVLEN